MDLTLAAAIGLGLMGLVLRVAAGRGRHKAGRIAWLAGLGLGFALTVAAMFTEATLLDAYLLGGFAALAAGGAGSSRRAAGTAVVVLGAGLALARVAGVFAELPPAGPGPITLLVVLAIGAGALASLAGRLLLTGSRAAVVLTVAGLWVLAGIHGVSGLEADLWGVNAALRVAEQPVYLVNFSGQTPLPERLVAPQGEAGLLLFSAALLVLATGAIPRWRKGLLVAGPVLALGAVVLLWVQGFGPLLGAGAAAVDALPAVLLAPGVAGARLDLAMLLPVLAAVAGGVGLIDATPSEGETQASELSLALIAGLLLIAALLSVWREVWGTPLWLERGNLMLAGALVALAWRIQFGRRQAWIGAFALWGGAVLLAGLPGNGP